ncbi:MAG: flagellar basal body P-ring formation chaperone FlgA [Alphaproteobacteria bacterium]
MQSINSKKISRVTCLTILLFTIHHPSAAARDIEIIKPVIQLSDLFPLVNPTQDKIVAAAPLPGESQHFTADHMANIASSYGLTANNNEDITITRKSRPITMSEITDMALKKITDQLPLDGLKRQFIADVTPNNMATTIEASLSLNDVQYNTEQQRLSFRVDANEGLDKPRTIARISGKLVDMVKVPILLQGVGTGDIIQASSIGWQEIRRDRLPANAILDDKKMVGMKARTYLRPNVALAAPEMMMPVAVKRGETVTMVLESDVMSITATGKAIQEGAVGDYIRAVNPMSNRVIEGEIIAPQTLRVYPPSQVKNRVGTNLALAR